MVRYRAAPSSQRGIALVMALVFLMLLTILGVTSMGTSTLEEKMATNTRDRTLAFEAAETALLAGETYIESLASDDAAGWADAAKGRYNYDATLTTPIWDSANWSTEAVFYPCTPADTDPHDSSGCATTSKLAVGEVFQQPKYIIERMGPADSTVPNTIAYRITARGTGASITAVAMVQSTYHRAF